MLGVEQVVQLHWSFPQCNAEVIQAPAPSSCAGLYGIGARLYGVVLESYVLMHGGESVSIQNGVASWTC